MTPNLNSTAEKTNLELEADDLAIIVKRDGTIIPVLGSREVSALQNSVIEAQSEISAELLQAYLFLSMIVTSACKPLQLAALDLISDPSIIDFNRLEKTGVVH